jgi:hypothetical protein
MNIAGARACGGRPLRRSLTAALLLLAADRAHRQAVGN